MNKNNRKKKGLSKRVLALMLCCFCLMATIPISAFALETGETQITEASISEQLSEITSEVPLSLSSETSESQTGTDTQQSTSDEIIEPVIENETETEVETEVNFEAGIGTDEVNPVCTCTPVNGVHADSCELYEVPEMDTSAVDALFAELMAFESYEALDAYMSEEMTEEEYVLMGSFTEEQNAALAERIEYLSKYDVEILDTVTAEQVLETFEHTASGSNYRTSNVYLAVRRDGNIPGEPSDQGSASYNFYNGRYSTGYGTFDTCPKGIINENIVDYQNFIFTSVDGTDTAGLVDSTGITTNQVLSGIDFDKLLDAIARNQQVKATDGQTVTTANKDNYKVVCYVIKLQLDINYGWHIDCAVVPKTYVTLSYDINIPDGYEIQTSGVGVPNSETGLPPATFNVGAMSGLTTIDGEQNAIKVVNANDSAETYVFMFQGWNTKADGSGTWYESDSKITIEENTVLYVIWDSNPAMGTGNLEILKIVNADVITDDATFTFQVTIKNADGSVSTDTYDYTFYKVPVVPSQIPQWRGCLLSANGTAGTSPAGTGSPLQLAFRSYNASPFYEMYCMY